MPARSNRIDTDAERASRKQTVRITMKRIFLTLALIAGMTAAVLADEFALSMDDGANVAQVRAGQPFTLFLSMLLPNLSGFPWLGFLT